MPKKIPIAIAKEQLQRMNDALTKPHLLIGGLAVNQYVSKRRTLDIDLVCSDETTQNLIDALYPSKEWDNDYSGDEYRPTYQFRRRQNPVEFEVTFGPKITERGPYQNIDWDILINDGSPYKISDKLELSNIIIPSCSGLIYTKILSFISRDAKNNLKRIQDLDDFSELTNCVFSFASLLGLIDSIENEDLLQTFVDNIQSEQENTTLEKSCLYKFLSLLRTKPIKTTLTAPSVNSDRDTRPAIIHASPKRLTTVKWLDNDRIVTSGFSGNIYIVDAKSMDISSIIETGHNMVRSVNVLSSGRYVLCGGDDLSLFIVDLEDQRIHNVGTTESPVFSIAVSQNEKKIYTAERKGLVDEWFLNLEAISEHPVTRARRIHAHQGGPAFVVILDEIEGTCLSGGQEGNLLATPLNSSDTQTRRKIRHPIFGMAIARTVFIYSDGVGHIYVKDSNKDEAFYELVGHSDNVRNIELSSCAKWLVSGSKDNSVRIWEIDSRRPKILYFGQDYIYDVALSPDNAKLVSVDGFGSCTVTHFDDALVNMSFEKIEKLYS